LYWTRAVIGNQCSSISAGVTYGLILVAYEVDMSTQSMSNTARCTFSCL